MAIMARWRERWHCFRIMKSVGAYLQLVGRDKWDRRKSDDRTIAKWKLRQNKL